MHVLKIGLVLGCISTYYQLEAVLLDQFQQINVLTRTIYKKKIYDEVIEVSKGAKIRNRYNQVPHLTRDTNGKVIEDIFDIINVRILKKLGRKKWWMFILCVSGQLSSVKRLA